MHVVLKTEKQDMTKEATVKEGVGEEEEEEVDKGRVF